MAAIHDYLECVDTRIVQRDLRLSVSVKRKEGATSPVRPGEDVEVTLTATDPDGSESFTPFDYGDYQMAKWRNFFPVDSAEPAL